MNTKASSRTSASRPRSVSSRMLRRVGRPVRLSSLAAIVVLTPWLPVGAETNAPPVLPGWLAQSIYQGGAIRSAWRTARLTQEQGLLQYETVVADSLLDVRTTYHDVLLAAQQIVVQEASINLLAQQLENTNRRFEAGMVPRFDV